MNSIIRFIWLALLLNNITCVVYAQKNIFKYSLKLNWAPHSENDLEYVSYVYPDAPYKFQVALSPKKKWE